MVINTYNYHIPNDTNPDPNIDHRGIVVYSPGNGPYPTKDKPMTLSHMDEIYSLADKFDPVIDPLNLFVRESFYERWFPIPTSPQTLENFNFFHKMLGIYFNYSFYEKTKQSNVIDITNGILSKTSEPSKYDVYRYLLASLENRKNMIVAGFGIPLGFRNPKTFGASQALQCYYDDYKRFFGKKELVWNYLISVIKTVADPRLKEVKLQIP